MMRKKLESASRGFPCEKSPNSSSNGCERAWAQNFRRRFIKKSPVLRYLSLLFVTGRQFGVPRSAR
jgi:hypothetical protein